MKNRNIYVIEAAVAAGLFAVLVFFFTHTRIRTDGLAGYVEKQTGLRLEEIVEKEEGDIAVSYNEEYGRIRLTLRSGGIEEVERQLDEMGKVSYNEWDIPPYSGSPLAENLKDEYVIGCYPFFRTVKIFFGLGGRTSHSAEIYVTTGRDGTGYVYFFG